MENLVKHLVETELWLSGNILFQISKEAIQQILVVCIEIRLVSNAG